MGTVAVPAAGRVVVTLPDNLEAVGTAELREMLRVSLAEVVGSIERMAAVWKELELRGENLSDLRDGIGYYLERVASGKLAAEAVGKFAAAPQRLRKLAALPLDEQRKVAAGESPAPWDKPGVRKPAKSNPYKRTRADDEVVSSPATPDVVGERHERVAAVAGPRDVAESILRQVQASKDPADVARRLLPDLQRLAEGKQTFGSRSYLD